jgi:anti-sigma regulatory factor (Ser/Thr protein kinase)
MGTPHAREFRILNRIAELDALADGLRDFCRSAGMSDEEFGDVRLAVEEAVSNTIRHGYADREPHPILLRASLEGGALCIEIEDDARAFDPLEAPLPDVTRPLEEKSPGGLGLLLLRSVADRLEYRREQGKNFLRFVRSLGRK